MRVAGARTGKNRWVRACYHGAAATLRSVTRVLHVLWLEITGLMFLLFAFAGGAAAVREYRHHAAGSMEKALLAASISVLFTYFGLSSFWRSRRRSSR